VKEFIDVESINSGFSEMTADEINCVSGGGPKTAGAALGLAGAIGAATYGSTFGVVAVGTAFAAAPIAVIAMVGLAGYAGYSYFSGGRDNLRLPVMMR
jgi:hypothetical protein